MDEEEYEIQQRIQTLASELLKTGAAGSRADADRKAQEIMAEEIKKHRQNNPAYNEPSEENTDINTNAHSEDSTTATSGKNTDTNTSGQAHVTKLISQIKKIVEKKFEDILSTVQLLGKKTDFAFQELSATRKDVADLKATFEKLRIETAAAQRHKPSSNPNSLSSEDGSNGSTTEQQTDATNTAEQAQQSNSAAENNEKETEQTQQTQTAPSPQGSKTGQDNSTPESTKEAPRSSEKPKQENPQTGGFSSDDVSVDKIFYCGNQ